MAVREQITKVIAGETNKPNGTYYYYIAPDVYTKFGVGLVINGTVTITLEATVDPDKDNATWEDITNAIFGAATLTATNDYELTDGKLTTKTWIRFKVVCAGGGTDDYRLLYKAA